MARPWLRRRIMAALGVGASALTVAACGGQNRAAVISRAQVVSEGNAICQQALAAVRVVPDSPAGITAAVAIVEKEARELRALPRPAQQLEILDAFISAEQSFASDYKALAAAQGDPGGAAAARATKALATNDAAALARSYGLSRCAGAGSSVASG